MTKVFQTSSTHSIAEVFETVDRRGGVYFICTGREMRELSAYRKPIYPDGILMR